VEGDATVPPEALIKLYDPLREDLEPCVRQLPIEGLKELGKAQVDYHSLQDVASPARRARRVDALSRSSRQPMLRELLYVAHDFAAS
jgi:hypothetical protein